MPFTKLLPSSIDLAQNFTFTGTVAGAGGGKIGQVLSTVFSTETSTSSSSWTTTGHSVTMTPAATSLFK